MKEEFAGYPIITKINPAFALMQTCRHIHGEIDALLVHNNVAYVPIVPARTYDESNLKIAQDAIYEGEGFITAFCALKGFRSTCFRVHSQGPLIVDRLMQGVQLYTTSSAKISAALGGEGRHAMLCLDECHVWVSNNCGRKKTTELIRTMASDVFTSWTLAWTMNTDTLFAKRRLCQDLIWLKREVRKINGENSNIELKVELYGRNKLFEEETTQELTRKLTSGSMLWKVGDQQRFV